MMNSGSISMTRFSKVGLALAATLLLVATACSGNDSTTSSTAASACDEVSALQDSLTALTQVDPVSDGTDALRSAATDVKSDLEAAASAVTDDLKPAVDQVRASLGDLEKALEGIGSGDGLGAAATDVGNSLSELGTSLTALSSEISETC